MRQRNREINVFSVSALDLFASALGAFILMSVIFMVFFSMTARESEASGEPAEALAQCETKLRDSVDASALAMCVEQLEDSVDASALARCEANLDRASAMTEELEACQRALRRTFVLVIASWSTRDDVDLHVVDSRGREFYFRNRTHSGTPAALEEDNTRGPGNEVWLHPSADPGRYRVCYKLFDGTPSPVVRGSVLWQEGKIELPNVGLTQDNQVRLVVEVVIEDDGRVAVDRSRSGQIVGYSGCA